MQDSIILACLHPGVSAKAKKEYFEKTCDIIKGKKIACDFAYDKNNLLIQLHSHAKNYNKVLVVIHSHKPVNNLPVSDNVFYFAGQRINKIDQFDLLEKHNIPIAEWLHSPESWNEVFAKLGEKIIAKPHTRAAGCWRVNYITKNNYNKFQLEDDLVYCKYIGPEFPPYWNAHVKILFGRVFSQYTVYNNSERVFNKYYESAMISDWAHKNIIKLALKTANIISNKHKCGIIGVDMAGNNINYVIETNNINIELPETENVSEKIANACIQKLKEI